MVMRATAGILPTAMALLLVLVGLVAADAQVGNLNPADMISRSLQSTDFSCSTEMTACASDESCINCLTTLSEGLQSCAPDADEADEADCSSFTSYFCCALEQEDSSCLDNTELATYLECFINEALEQNGVACDLDISDCSGANGRGPSWGMSFLAISGAVAGVMVAIFSSVV